MIKNGEKNDRYYFFTVVLVCFFFSAFVSPTQAHHNDSVASWEWSGQGECGVPVTFILTGGGYGEVSGKANNRVALYDTNEKSLLTILTPKGETAGIRSIKVNGSLKAISAKTTALTGDITITGSLGRLALNSAEDSTISIGTGSTKAAVTIAFDLAYNLKIDSDTPIRSITATELVNGSISAPSVGSITIKGDEKRYIWGDLDIDVTVPGVTGTVKVANALSGDWDCNTVKSITALEADDFYLTLSRKPDHRILALGKLTIKESFNYSQIISSGNIGAVTAGEFWYSNCFAGVDYSSLKDLNVDYVFDLPVANAANFSETATIKSIAIKGVKDDDPPNFVNSNLAAANILSVSIAYPQAKNSGIPFGVTAGYIKSLNIKTDNGPVSLKNLDDLFGDIQIRLY